MEPAAGLSTESDEEMKIRKITDASTIPTIEMYAMRKIT